MTLQLVKPAQCEARRSQCTFGELACGEKFHLETDRVQARQQILVKVTDTEARPKFRNYGKYNVPADTQVVRVKDIEPVAEPMLPKPVDKTLRDFPRYMFEEKAVTPTTWIELQKMDTYHITRYVALLVNADTREYCYVYWDAGEQCSNPYKTFAEAEGASKRYMEQL